LAAMAGKHKTDDESRDAINRIGKSIEGVHSRSG
jgi:hypothetical protein